MSQWNEYNEVVSGDVGELQEFVPCAQDVILKSMARFASADLNQVFSVWTSVLSYAMKVAYIMGQRSAMIAPFERAMFEIDNFEDK